MNRIVFLFVLLIILSNGGDFVAGAVPVSSVTRDDIVKFNEKIGVPDAPSSSLQVYKQAFIGDGIDIDNIMKISIVRLSESYGCYELVGDDDQIKFITIPNRPFVDSAVCVHKKSEYLYDIGHSFLINPELSHQPRMLLVFVHGTLSGPDSYGVNLDRPTTTAVRVLGQILARAHSCTVQVMAFEWSGALSVQARIRAGEFLASEVALLYEKHKICATWLFGHSHGCNVLNHALKKLAEKNICPDIAMYMASPLPDAEAYPFDGQAFNVGNVYHFFTWCDNIQPLGSLQSMWTLAREMPDFKTRYGKVYNIHVQLHGSGVHHQDIKHAILFNALGLVHALGVKYANCFSLDVNLIASTVDIFKQSVFPYPMISIRKNGDIQGDLCPVIEEYDATSRNVFQDMYGRSINDSDVWYSSFGQLSKSFFN